ncbi:MAG: hypothetical protein EA363_10725 [Balneolaceae bacterium]|nr:MAG: hypothetical protein EA363_10725 [Balneolaceae bacterium]
MFRGIAAQGYCSSGVLQRVQGYRNVFRGVATDYAGISCLAGSFLKDIRIPAKRHIAPIYEL